MILLSEYIQQISETFPGREKTLPWDLVRNISSVITEKIRTLGDDYLIEGAVAIHKTARIEQHVVIKDAVLIGPGCFVGAHAYLRGGVYLGSNSVIGPGCEVKSTFIMQNSALAHFNFAGDSIIGSSVNMEAGSVIANHFNEREDKTIYIVINGVRKAIDTTKFGAIVGDGTRIGANAVLSPGTVLPRHSIVRRLELIEQS